MANKEDIIISLLRDIDLNIGNAGGGGNNTGGGEAPMVNTTWVELKALHDAGKLIAGLQYRITDYVATTIDPESRSANHPFDIIVTADDEHTLNESARAIAHEGDTYFEKCNLNAWQLKYCLDNDIEKFAWAQQAFEGYQVIIEGMVLNTELVSSEDTTHTGYPYRLLCDFQGITLIIYSNTLESNDTFVWVNIGGGEEDVELPIAIHGVVTEEGKGVIYYLKDEYNNESCYDFKGVQFRRYKSNIAGEDIKFCTKDIYDTTCTEEYEYFYLFSVLLDNSIIDESVQFSFEELTVYNNKIFTLDMNNSYPLHLPHIVNYTNLQTVFRTFICNSIITGHTGTLYGFTSNNTIERCCNFFVSSQCHSCNIKDCENFVLNNNTRFVNMRTCSELRINNSYGYKDVFILGGVKGNIIIDKNGSSNADTRFTYFVAKNSQEEIKIFNPADIV